MFSMFIFSIFIFSILIFLIFIFPLFIIYFIITSSATTWGLTSLFHKILNPLLQFHFVFTYFVILKFKICCEGFSTIPLPCGTKYIFVLLKTAKYSFSDIPCFIRSTFPFHLRQITDHHQVKQRY